MREKIKEIEEKIKTKEDLIFFLYQIDLAYDLIQKNPLGDFWETLKEKIDPFLYKVLESIEKEREENEKNKFEKKKEELLVKTQKAKEELAFILKKEKELEEKIKKISEKEEKLKGKNEEKEIERQRWALEEERIKIEREKWELREMIEKLDNELKELKPKNKEKNPSFFLFFLEQTRGHLLSLEEVTLEVAVDFPGQTFSAIEKWFKENLGKKIILNLNLNPKIIGGAIIEYKGKIFDFSLVEKIKNEIEKLKI